MQTVYFWCRLSTIDSNRHTKFHGNFSIHVWIITFLKFKMVAEFEFFCRIGLKCHSRPRISVSGGLNPKLNWSSSTPHKAHPWPKAHLHGEWKSVYWCDMGASWNNQKKKGEERNFQWPYFPITLGSGLYNSLYYTLQTMPWSVPVVH